MLVEPWVLDSNYRINEVGGHFLEGNLNPVLVIEGRDQLTFSVSEAINIRGLGGVNRPHVDGKALKHGNACGGCDASNRHSGCQERDGQKAGNRAKHTELE